MEGGPSLGPKRRDRWLGPVSPRMGLWGWGQRLMGAAGTSHGSQLSGTEFHLQPCGCGLVFLLRMGTSCRGSEVRQRPALSRLCPPALACPSPHRTALQLCRAMATEASQLLSHVGTGATLHWDLSPPAAAAVAGHGRRVSQTSGASLYPGRLGAPLPRPPGSTRLVRSVVLCCCAGVRGPAGSGQGVLLLLLLLLGVPHRH